ncbi:hypothetical protein ON010_g13275 [Phytophthora cinnamomi]|nr:hypothetical protein ON010_g13275 [Phytophthora cinnamomi]
MKKRPKNNNKPKLRGAEASKTASVVNVAMRLGVHRSSVYRWRKHDAALAAGKKTGSKFYVRTSSHEAVRVRNPILEKRLLDYVAEMRKNRKLCVTTKCLILMMAKFDPDYVRVRKYAALRSWTVRFLKRNRLVVRRITHKDSRTRSDMQVVRKMDGRCSVFLCASATGEKLPPFAVFAGVPGCRVADEVTASSFGSAAVEHTVKPKAWSDHAIMKEWIAKCRWLPDAATRQSQGSQNGKHPADPRGRLRHPSSVYSSGSYWTVSAHGRKRDGLFQKEKISEDLYLKYRIDHPFPANAAERRVMLSFLVAKAWDLIKVKTIVKAFRKAKLLPIGPRDEHGGEGLSPIRLPVSHSNRLSHWARLLRISSEDVVESRSGAGKTARWSGEIFQATEVVLPHSGCNVETYPKCSGSEPVDFDLSYDPASRLGIMVWRGDAQSHCPALEHGQIDGVCIDVDQTATMTVQYDEAIVDISPIIGAQRLGTVPATNVVSTANISEKKSRSTVTPKTTAKKSGATAGPKPAVKKQRSSKAKKLTAAETIRVEGDHSHSSQLRSGIVVFALASHESVRVSGAIPTKPLCLIESTYPEKHEGM